MAVLSKTVLAAVSNHSEQMEYIQAVREHISNYDAKVAELKKDGKIDYEKEWKSARDYNGALVPMILPDSFAFFDAKREKG